MGEQWDDIVIGQLVCRGVGGFCVGMGVGGAGVGTGVEGFGKTQGSEGNVIVWGVTTTRTWCIWSQRTQGVALSQGAHRHRVR